MNAFEIVSLVLQKLYEKAKAGVYCRDLNNLAEKLVTENGGVCVDKNYFPKELDDIPLNVRPKSPFPNAMVINVNSVIAHGIFQEEYKLRHGDTISFDIGVEKDGVCADAAFTMGIPSISVVNENLIKAAKLALEEGMKVVKAGANVKDISHAIEQFVVANGYVVNEAFGGHGIGSEMHQDPFIPNYTSRDQKDYFLKEGEMICIEPLLTFNDKFGMLVNDWTVVTRDGKHSAFFETQLLVTKDGYKQLIDLPDVEFEGRN